MNCRLAIGAALAAVTWMGIAAELPSGWEIKPFRGRTLWASYKYGGFMHGPHPDVPMFRHTIYESAYLKMNASKLILWGSKDFAHFRTKEEYWDKGFPIKFPDVINTWWSGDRELLDAYERWFPGQLFQLTFWGDGPCPVNFEEKYDLDIASFEQWKKEHPGFAGFTEMLSEVDNSMHGYFQVINNKKRLEPEVRKWFEANYPTTGNFSRDLPNWLDIAVPRVRARSFNDPTTVGLYSINLLTGHLLGKAGCSQIWYEAELGSTSSPWRFGGMFVRGAGRQFDIPWAWYMATLVEGQQTRDGVKQKGYGTSFVEWPSPFMPKAVPYKGAARSLMARSIMYGYFAGATILRQEKAWEFLGAYASDGTATLSPYAWDFNEPFAFDEKRARGAPYTPVALLLSIYERQHRQHITHGNKDMVSMPAFLQTIVPTYEKSFALVRDSSKGDQGAMWNSEFGEICDVLCPDIPRNAYNHFADVIKNYRVAFLIGAYEKKDLDTAALVDFVKQGGELIVERRHVAAGFVPETVADAKGKITVVEHFLPDYFRTAKDNLHTIAGKLTSCEVTCPVIHDLLKKAQDEHMPFKVEGDIQWGVNKVRSKSEEGRSEGERWLVWLINNKGSEKYYLEPERINAKAKAHVKVTSKKTGKVYEKDVPAAGWSFIEIAE